MAEFYGTIRGNRGKATRTGSKNSGIITSAETWRRKVVVEINPDKSCTVKLLTKQGSLLKVLFSSNNIDTEVPDERIS
jgi:hypothetical protein